MKQLIKLLFLCLALIASKESFALACLKDYSTSTDSIALNTTIAVPSVLPKGTVLWRSSNYSISMTCWQDGEYALGEYVYFWVSPLDPMHAQLGPDLQLGINLDGKDLLCSEAKCRFQVSDFYFYGCNQWNGCASSRQKRTLNFNFFIAKASEPSAGKERALTGVSSYAAFQLDGVNQINPNPDKNFRMYVTGLDKLRYVGCASTVDVSPRTIDFGSVGSFSAKKGAVIQDRPILITATKDCSSAYGLGGNFLPISGTLTDANKTLVPLNNNSVGIQLLKREDNTPIEFNKEFQIVPLNNRDRYVEKKSRQDCCGIPIPQCLAISMPARS